MTPTVILTRPEAEAQRAAARLADAGFASRVLPLLQLEALNEVVWDGDLVLSAQDAVIFISANAVAFGMPYIATQLRESDAVILAVGERTARAVADWGLEAAIPEQPDSEGLLAMPELQSIGGQRVVIVKGEGGRSLLATQLGALGAHVDALICYRRIYPSAEEVALYERLKDLDSLIFQANSGETLSHLSDLLDLPANSSMARWPVIVPSRRVAMLAEGRGWKRIITARDASDAALIEALWTWQDYPTGQREYYDE